MKLKHCSFALTRVFGVVLAGVLALAGLYKTLNSETNSVASANPLINISSLSEEFMETYLKDYAEVAADDNKENILIVASEKPLESSFGAKRVVNAANNQYFLEYNSEEEKTFAYEQISHMPTLTVSENQVHTILDEAEDNGSYNSWGIEKMGLDYASEMIEESGNASEIVVAVLDTGLDVELFNENFPDKLAGTYSVVSGKAEVPDEVGHGTHTAGTIAEGTPSNVKIYSVQLSKERGIYTTDIIAGMDYTTYYTNADVANMSFGGYSYEEAEYISLEAMREKKIIPVASAGNESTNNLSYPASFDNTISVSALDVNLNFASEFSNFGKTIDFAAPGVDILSINGTMSGTSMSAPHASAAAAIAKSLDKDFNLETAREFLSTRTIDLGAKGKDSQYGYGFIDFNDARFCTAQSEACDEFEIFETEIEDAIEVVNVALTPYNYGSLTNILATTIRITNRSGSYKEKALGDFGTDIEITGYDPYASGEQEVVVKYGEMTTSFTVENPENWESGWIVGKGSFEGESENELINQLVKYKDHGMNIKTLYIPEEVDGETIAGTHCPFDAEMYDGSWGCNDSILSNDAQQYETIVLPETLRIAGGFSGNWNKNGNFQNVYQIISLADELIVKTSAFSYLRSLTKLDATITFNVTHSAWSPTEGFYGEKWYAGSVFLGDTSLESVRLSNNNDVIPSSTFSECKSLEAIELPDSVKEIQTQAFYGAGVKVLDLKNVEKLERQAFYDSNLEEIFISATLTEIEDGAFAGTNSLEKLVVDANNPVYDSRDNANAIIKTDENKLIVGTRTTIIPETVETIGAGAFNGSYIYEITIPEGVLRIEPNAFVDCFSLQKVVLPRTLASLEDDSFVRSGWSIPSTTIFWIWDHTYAKERVFELDYPYVLMDEVDEEPKLIADMSFEVIPERRVFYAYDTISPENFIINVFYYDEEADEVIEDPEVVTNYSVIYNNGETENLVGGDNLVSFVFDTETGYKNIKVGLWLSVKYLEPEYTVPEGITAWSGQPLIEVELPDGFAWMNNEEFVDESKTEYLANFTPEDAVHYGVVENIAIPVEVKTGTTFAEVFPDEVLRACIIRNLNLSDETENYTEETVDLDKVLAITELNCAADEGEDKITNARGIERMTQLELLDLSGNSLDRINLSKNLEMEHLDLRGNKLQELNIMENSALNELLVDESGLEDGSLLLMTAAYVEFDGEGDNTRLIMDLSELDFLDGADFVIEDASATYDAETRTISWSADNPVADNKVRITVRLETGEEISYSIYCFPRKIYVTILLDGEIYEKDLDFGFTYTGGWLNLKGFGENLIMMLGLTGYELEDAVVTSDPGVITVGKSDVRISMYFRNTEQQGDDEPEDPSEPGDPTEPEDPSEPYDDSDEETEVGTPDTGALITNRHNDMVRDDTSTLLLFIAAAVVLAVSFLPRRTLKRHI